MNSRQQLETVDICSKINESQIVQSEKSHTQRVHTV